MKGTRNASATAAILVLSLLRGTAALCDSPDEAAVQIAIVKSLIEPRPLLPGQERGDDAPARDYCVAHTLPGVPTWINPPREVIDAFAGHKPAVHAMSACTVRERVVLDPAGREAIRVGYGPLEWRPDGGVRVDARIPHSAMSLDVRRFAGKWLVRVEADVIVD
jgi:hypothetical protein